MMCKRICLLLMVVGAMATASVAEAVLLYDFETGIDNVANGAGFGFADTSVAWSNDGTGATSGTGALQATADVDDFHWMAVINANATAANVAAIQAAYAAPAAWQWEFDVTVVSATMPQWSSFVNGVFVVNSENAGFDQTGNVWGLGGTDSPPATMHVTIPLSSIQSDVVPGGNWLELGFSLNGDWGDVPGSIYIDTIEINLIPEPASIGLLCLGFVAVWSGVRRRG